MKFLHRVIYWLLILKNQRFGWRITKPLRNSSTNSTSKTILTGNCSLVLNSTTNKNIELVRSNMFDIVKNSNFTAEFLLELIKKKGIKVVYLKDAYKLLTLMGEEEGLIFERRGFSALMLNLISGSGISLHSKPLFILGKNNNDFYFLLFHFYKLHGYFQKLPGFDVASQELFKLYSRNAENCNLSKLGLEDMTALKEAVARDNEASEFVLEISKQKDGTKIAFSKFKDGGAKL